MRTGEECCKSKGVPRLCLGFCVREQKKYESFQRSTQCYEFRQKMEACLEGNITHINSSLTYISKIHLIIYILFCNNKKIEYVLEHASYQAGDAIPTVKKSKGT